MKVSSKELVLNIAIVGGIILFEVARVLWIGY
jgi:hypothetical protein